LGPGQVSAAKNGQKPALLMTSLTKKTKPKTKIFFHCRLEGGDIAVQKHVQTAGF